MCTHTTLDKIHVHLICNYSVRQCTSVRARMFIDRAENEIVVLKGMNTVLRDSPHKKSESKLRDVHLKVSKRACEHV